MLVYFGGEDMVTKLIAKRLIEFVTVSKDVILEDANPRDYGTRALDKLDLMCRLSNSAPVICVFDSDGDCVVDILKKYAINGWKKSRLAINIAIDEGESWLMADRDNFAKYFGIKKLDIPIRKEHSLELSESIPYKTSLFFIQRLVPLSTKSIVKNTFACDRPGKKPATYNNLWLDFIEKHWNIEEAAKNSSSLSRSIERVRAAIVVK